MGRPTDLLVRPLAKSDDRSQFSCGDAALDRFFRDYAGQNQFRHGINVTYVALETDQIVGFGTVAAGSVEGQELPSKAARRRLPAYPIPVLRLARLGVDERAQGKGVAAALLRHVFKLALTQRETMGCLGVVVDAKPGAIGLYARFGFEALLDVRMGAIHGGPKPMFLDIRTIAAAMP